MTDFLNDYKNYYQARVTRFANDPDFPETFKAEQNLCNAILSCNQLEELREKMGNLNNKVAVAQTIDKYNIRHNHYLEIKEIIRAKGPERIIAKAGNYEKVMDLITMVTEEENKNSVEITTDSIQPFDDWMLLERIEVYENAEVPEKYKSEMKESVEEMKKSVRESLERNETEYKKWVPSFQFNANLVFEERHRRTFPFKDGDVKARLEEFRKITNH